MHSRLFKKNNFMIITNCCNKRVKLSSVYVNIIRFVNVEKLK